MDVSTNLTTSTPIKFTSDRINGERKNVRQRMSDNSEEVVLTSGTATAASGAFIKIANIYKKISTTAAKTMRYREEQILSLLEKSKYADRLLSNPLVRKFAWLFGGAAAAVTVITSTAKVFDTYGYLTDMGKAA